METLARGHGYWGNWQRSNKKALKILKRAGEREEAGEALDLDRGKAHWEQHRWTHLI